MKTWKSQNLSTTQPKYNMELLKFKSVSEAKIYFMSNVLPFMENEDALTADTLFSLWIDNPMDYQPDVIVEIEEAKELSESDIYDNDTKHD